MKAEGLGSLPAELSNMEQTTVQPDRQQSVESDAIGMRLRRNITGTAAVRLSGMTLAFVSNIVIARLLGADEYGLLRYILSWVGVLTVVSVFGQDRMLVREVAVYRLNASWAQLKGLLRWTHFSSGLIGLAIVGLFHLIASRGRLDGGLADAAPAAGFLLLSFVILRLLSSSLQGLQLVAWSQFAEAVLQPGLGLVFIIFALGLHRSVTPSQLLVLYAVAAGCACLSIWKKLRTSLPKLKAPPIYMPKHWVVSALPLALVGLLDILNSQISSLILGTYAGTTALGIYAAAERGSQLVSLPLAVVSLTLAPVFANLYQVGDVGGLQRLVTRSSRLILLWAAPIAVGLILGASWFLLLFGAEFTQGRTSLWILCGGQLVNAGIGSVAFLLMMTGNGREAAIGTGIGVAVNASLCSVLVPPLGATGAAISTAVGVICWNVMLAFFVKNRLGITPTALGSGTG